jgi:hypothetical protein
VFRERWSEFENQIQEAASEFRSRVLEKFQGSKSKVERMVPDPLNNPEDFIKWGREYVKEVRKKADSEKVERARENFFVLLRNLGLNDQVVRETFSQNKKEILDPLIGEMVALVALVLGWKEKDKEVFSQALGEIGVAGVFAAKPFLCVIAICGLAYGYQENFHSESFKKGGVLGLAGMAAMAITTTTFVGILAAIVTILYLNKKLNVERPIENQLKEIFQTIRSGAFFKDVRKSWSRFEDFLGQLFRRDPTASEGDLVTTS